MRLSSIPILGMLILSACGGANNNEVEASTTTVVNSQTTEPSTTSTESISVAPSSSVLQTTVGPTKTVPAQSTTPITTMSPGPTSTASVDELRRFVCDADSAEVESFDVPLGTEVSLTITSATEREFHLHGYDIELSGTRVVFTFIADIPGTNPVSIHPGHATVCTLSAF